MSAIYNILKSYIILKICFLIKKYLPKPIRNILEKINERVKVFLSAKMVENLNDLQNFSKWLFALCFVFTCLECLTMASIIFVTMLLNEIICSSLRYYRNFNYNWHKLIKRTFTWIIPIAVTIAIIPIVIDDLQNFPNYTPRSYTDIRNIYSDNEYFIFLCVAFIISLCINFIKLALTLLPLGILSIVKIAISYIFYKDKEFVACIASECTKQIWDIIEQKIQINS